MRYCEELQHHNKSLVPLKNLHVILMMKGRKLNKQWEGTKSISVTKVMKFFFLNKVKNQFCQNKRVKNKKKIIWLLSLI
jgi:hypothetical protein